MSIITGRLAPTGAIVDLFVGVSSRLVRVMRTQKLKVPETVHLRVLIDTGSTVSGFSPWVFESLGLKPVTRQRVYTPSTTPNEPHERDFFDVAISIVAEGRINPFGDFRVIDADCWLPGEGAEGLIGWDILNRCWFQCHGPERTFTLSF